MDVGHLKLIKIAVGIPAIFELKQCLASYFLTVKAIEQYFQGIIE